MLRHCFLIALCIGPGVSGAGEPGIGSAAPDCALTEIGGTPGRDLREFRGKVLYVDFWASWCPPCARSFPFMNDLEREFGGRGLQVLGINVDAKRTDAEAFLARHPARFAVGADHEGACPRKFSVPAMPTSYVIDRAGVIRYRQVGFREEHSERIRGWVAELLAEPEAGR